MPTAVIMWKTALPLSTVIGGSCHKYYFCRDKTCLLLQQKYACRGKTIVAANIILSRQKFCCNKHTFVAANTFLLRQKNACSFVVTKLFVATNISCDTCLSRQT